MEKAEQAIEADEAQRVTQRLLAAKFDFNDFLAQFKMMNNMGSMGAVMKMLPGAGLHPPKQPPAVGAPHVQLSLFLWSTPTC